MNEVPQYRGPGLLPLKVKEVAGETISTKFVLKIYTVCYVINITLTYDIDDTSLLDLMVLHYSWYGHVGNTCVNSSLRSSDIRRS